MYVYFCMKHFALKFSLNRLVTLYAFTMILPLVDTLFVYHFRLRSLLINNKQ